ncbi:hypothetical protein MCEREM21A_02234 [Sphingomonadaceae bacterium]
MHWIAKKLAMVACFVIAPSAESKPAEPARFGHLSACIDDPEASAKFFSDVFGWQRPNMQSAATSVPTKQLEERATNVTWVDAHGFYLELIKSSTADDDLCTHGSYRSLTFVPPNWPISANTLPVTEKDAGKLDFGAHLAERITDSGGQFLVPKSITGQLDIRLSPARGLETYQNSNTGKVSEPRVDRIAIIVRNAEETARFFTEKLGLRRHPDAIDLDGAANPESGGIHVVFVDANGVWLALVQPVGAGPLNAYLDTHGDGVIAELIIEVPSVADFYDRMAAENITLVNTRGAPVDPVAKAHVLEPFRDKIAYFPADVTGGLTIELVERGDKSTSLLEHRDRKWTAMKKGPQPQGSGGKP